MRLRYTFGQTLDNTELSPDVNFVNPIDLVVWGSVTQTTTAGTVTIATNTPDLVVNTDIPGIPGASPNNRDWSLATIYSINNIFSAGKRYHCEIELGEFTATVQSAPPLTFKPESAWTVEVFVGNMSTSKSQYLCLENQVIEFDLWALEDAPIRIQIGIWHEESIYQVLGEYHIKNFSVKEYDWNTPSNYYQKNESKLTIENSELFSGLKVEYINDVELFEDDYKYFLALGLTEEPVLTRVEYQHEYENTWSEFFVGFVYPANIEYKRNSCMITIESIYSTFLNACKDKKFSPISFIDRTTYGLLFQPNLYVTYIWLWDYNRIAQQEYVLHNTTDGVDAGFTSLGFYVWKFMRMMIHEYSDCLITLESDYFGLGGDFEYLIFTQDEFMYWLPYNEHKFQVSFDDFMTNLDHIFTLGIVSKKSATQYIIKVEPLNDLRSAASITLNGLENEAWKYKLTKFYSAVEVGFVSENADKGGTETYNSIEKNTTEKFTRSVEFLRNSNKIQTVLGGTTERDFYYIELYDAGANMKSIQYGQDILPDNVLHSYNGLICFDAIMDMMLPTLYLTYQSATYPTVIKTGTETIYRSFDSVQADMTLAQLLTLKSNPYTKIVVANSYENVATSYIERLEFELENGRTIITLEG